MGNETSASPLGEWERKRCPIQSSKRDDRLERPSNHRRTILCWIWDRGAMLLPIGERPTVWSERQGSRSDLETGQTVPFQCGIQLWGKRRLSGIGIAEISRRSFNQSVAQRNRNESQRVSSLGLPGRVGNADSCYRRLHLGRRRVTLRLGASIQYRKLRLR